MLRDLHFLFCFSLFCFSPAGFAIRFFQSDPMLNIFVRDFEGVYLGFSGFLPPIIPEDQMIGFKAADFLPEPIRSKCLRSATDAILTGKPSFFIYQSPRFGPMAQIDVPFPSEKILVSLIYPV